MIDFRYHIVSLISVFLALAVGIVLGAGPLEATIGGQLTDQVEQLRVEKDELRVELDQEIAVSSQRAELIQAAAPEILAGSLPRTVAVVTLPGADEDVVGDVVGLLGQAGATVASRVAVTPAWTDPEQQALRASIVGNVGGYLDQPPSAEESGDVVLGRALAQALTAADPESPDTLADEAGLILEVLTSGQLVSVTAAPERPAQAVVVLAPSGEDVSPDAVEALVALADALAAAGEGAVVGGPADDETDLVAAVRAGDAAARVATVDGVEGIIGQVILPRALARAVAGDVGHFGFAGAAEDVLPERVDLTAGTA